MNIFLAIVSIVTGVSTLVGFLTKTYTSISSIENKLQKWEETLNKNTLYILKLALFSEGLPDSDRINAGQQYLKINQDYFVEKKY